MIAAIIRRMKNTGILPIYPEPSLRNNATLSPVIGMEFPDDIT